MNSTWAKMWSSKIPLSKSTSSFPSQLLLTLCNELLQQQQQLKLHCTLAHSYQWVFSPSFRPDISRIVRKAHQVPPVKRLIGDVNHTTTLSTNRFQFQIAHARKKVLLLSTLFDWPNILSFNSFPGIRIPLDSIAGTCSWKAVKIHSIAMPQC